MDRYKTAFYEPLVSDLRNHGAWRDDGAKSSAERATKIWQNTLRDFKAPQDSATVADRLAAYIERGKAKGGAAPSGG